jgi:hypothetical protein
MQMGSVQNNAMELARKFKAQEDGNAVTFDTTSATTATVTLESGKFKIDTGTGGTGSSITAGITLVVKEPAAFTVPVGALTVAGTLNLEEGASVSVEDTPSPTPVITAVDGDLEIGKTGNPVLTFAAGGNLSVATGTGIVFDGNVFFGGDLTLTQVPAEFNGNAFFADGKALIMTHADSVVTLKGALAHGDPVSGVPVIYSAVLMPDSDNEDGVTLTPLANTKLTFSTGSGKGLTQAPHTGASGHSITIGGKAHLVAGATYTVASDSTNNGILTIDDGAELTLGHGFLLDAVNNPTFVNSSTINTSASLVLTGAANADGAILEGDGKVVAG